MGLRQVDTMLTWIFFGLFAQELHHLLTEPFLGQLFPACSTKARIVMLIHSANSAQNAINIPSKPAD